LLPQKQSELSKLLHEARYGKVQFVRAAEIEGDSKQESWYSTQRCKQGLKAAGGDIPQEPLRPYCSSTDGLTQK
jgi:hypothetical protein